jgi:hypothetical protein
VFIFADVVDLNFALRSTVETALMALPTQTLLYIQSKYLLFIAFC